MIDYFKSLKIIDLSSVLAGPSVGMFFAELGAQVTKIEHPIHGDVTRHWKLPAENPEAADSAYFASINYGKTIRSLDLKDKNHLKTLHSIIEDADVVISNYKDSSLKKFRLDYDQLIKINPQIILAQLSSYNEEGKAAYDVIMQAETGYLSMSGTEKEYCKMPVALIDVVAAHQLKEAILVGIIRRIKENKGSYFKLSLYDAAVTSLVNQASNYLNVGHLPTRMGTQHPNIAPYGDLFVSKDKLKFVLAVVTDIQFKRLISFVAQKETDGPNFRTNQERLDHRTDLINYLQKAFDGYTMIELEDGFNDLNIPYGRVLALNEVLDKKENQKLILETTHQSKYRIIKSLAFKLIK